MPSRNSVAGEAVVAVRRNSLGFTPRARSNAALKPPDPGERERWLSVADRTTVEPDGAHDLCARLAARYWDLDDPARADALAGILDADWVRLVIHPETVSRYTF